MFLFFPLLYLATFFAGGGMDIKQMSDSIKELSQEANGYLDTIPEVFLPVLQSVKDTILSTNSAKAIGEFLLGIFKGFGKVVYDSIFIVVFFTIFNLYGYSIFRNIYALIPIKADDKRQVIKNGYGTISLILYSSLFNIFAMGFAFGIFIALISDLDALMFGLLAGFSSIIPVIGGVLIYLPVSLYFVSEGEVAKAIITVLYGAVFMGFFIDSILRVLFIRYTKKALDIKSNINEITIIFSMFAGVSTLGFWGIIIGPATVSMLLALIHSKRYRFENEVSKR